MNNLYDELMSAITKEMEEIVYDVIAAEKRQTVRNQETGEIEESCRYTVEIPKGNGTLSRSRFTVKILEKNLRIDPAQLENEAVFVQFNGLKISYIDPKKNVYFRADSLVVVKGDR